MSGTPSHGRVDVRTLGPVRVLCDGTAVKALEPRRRNLAVLILLAVEREVDRERLASFVWADREPKKARQSLSEALYELRGHLGTAWLETSGSVIRATEHLDCDAVRFRAAAHDGDASAAMRLYEDHFLRVFSLNVPEFEQWADGQERDLFGTYRNAADRAVTEARSSGDLESALGFAREWVRLRPDDDEAQHYLIALLALSGNRAAALRQYEAYERVLEEAEITPLDRTAALISAVRAGQEAAIASLVRLSDDVDASTERATQSWFTRPRAGPRLALIRDPKEVEGRAVPLGAAPMTLGPGGDLAIGGSRVDSETVLATVAPGRERDHMLLTPHPGCQDVYVLIPAPRVLREGDAFRVGQQVFILERLDP